MAHLGRLFGSMAYHLLEMAYRKNVIQEQIQVTQDSSGKTHALNEIRDKEGSVTVMLGTRGMGKTELAYRYAEFLGRPTFAVSPEQQPPNWIKKVSMAQVFEIIPPMSTLIYDDIPAYAGNRDYTDAGVKGIERLIPMVRHEKKLQLIFCSQSAAQADKYILDCDMAFFKPLGILFEDFERQNIKKIYRDFVNPEFDGMPMSFILRHAYMWSRYYRGLIPVTLSHGGPPIEGTYRDLGISDDVKVESDTESLGEEEVIDVDISEVKVPEDSYSPLGDGLD